MGNEYTHPDDFDHYIESVTLFNGDVKLAQATYVPGTLGNTKAHNTTTFTIIPTGTPTKACSTWILHKTWNMGRNSSRG